MKDLKQKVFGLYIGQQIGYIKDSIIAHCVGSDHMINHTDHIEVIHLLNITYEHAEKVSELCVYGDDKRVVNIKQWAHIYAMQSSLICDFLRSNGYALPAFGHSIEELVTMGIFKLREA